MLKVLLADQRETARRATKSYLSQYRSEWEVIGEAENSDGLLSKLAGLQPDVVILSGSLPGSPMLSLVSTLKAEYPGPSILVLGPDREAALAVGADAFVCQGETPERLLTALRVIRCEREDE